MGQQTAKSARRFAVFGEEGRWGVTAKAINIRNDLYDYDSPIKSATGAVPFNGYLWPTEAYYPEPRSLRNRIDSRFHIAIVELLDGRWSVSGVVHEIMEKPVYTGAGKEQPPLEKVVFETREQALRVSTARMLRVARAARRWPINFISRKDFIDLFNWAIRTVNIECGKPAKKTIDYRTVKVTAPKTGLELWDFYQGKGGAA